MSRSQSALSLYPPSPHSPTSAQVVNVEELVPVAGSFRGENDAQVTIHFDQLRWRKQRQWVVMWPRPRLSGARVFERLRMRKVWYTLGHRHAVVSLVASLALPTLLLQEEFVPCPSRFLLRNANKTIPRTKTLCGTEWFSLSFP